MAGRYGSNSAVLLLDGFNLLAAKIQTFRVKREALQEQSDGCGDEWEEHSPTGKKKAEVAQEGGFFDTATGSSHTALGSGTPSTPQSTARVGCVGFAGNTVGAHFVGLAGAFQTDYEVLADNGKLQKANAALQASGIVENGAIVHPLGAQTADANTESTPSDHTTEMQRNIPITSNSQANPTVVTTPVPHGLTTGDTVLISGVAGSSPTINGERAVTVISTTTFSVAVDTSAGSGGTGGSFVRGKTQAGGAGYLQMTALTLGGHDGALVSLLDSADGNTFAELLAFTVRTTIGAERVAVSGTVERYTAAAIDFTGAGSGPSATFMAGFARAA